MGLLDDALNKPLPMEGRFNILPVIESQPGMGPSLFNERKLALPGMLAGIWNAFTLPGRAMAGQEVTPEDPVNFAMNFMGGGLGASRFAPAPRGSVGMNAYHGSRHVFDAFDANKIGSGEGAQAFGHGLYFAENPAVARDYMTAGQSVVPNQTIYKGRNADQWYQHFYDQMSRNPRDEQAKAATAFWEKVAARQHPASAKNVAMTEDWPELAAYAKSVDLKDFKGLPPANLYHVDIPDEAVAKMLDWDKPLSQQPQNVKDAFTKLGLDATDKGYDALVAEAEAQAKAAWDRFMREGTDQAHRDFLRADQDQRTLWNSRASDMKGSDAYRNIAQNDRLASERLRELGVPGIRYLDAGSRGAGNGTRNLVLFDDKLAKITKRE